MLRDHLKAVERMTRRSDPRLRRRCPQGAAYLWRWFLELHAARQPGPAGPAPLSFSEIGAWASLRRVPVSADDVSALRALDSLFLEVHYQ